MKLNISYPQTGGQKVFEINEEAKTHYLMEKHMGQQIDGTTLGEQFKGYVFKISGGNDKQGFPMKQGILTPNRVRVLLKKGDKCYRERRSGERKKKSVRGCIVSNEICVLDLVVMKKGVQEIEGVTDVRRPRRLGPKRANKIRKLFNLPKKADVRKYVIRRKLAKGGSKAPKIQRLVTLRRVERKRRQERMKIAGAKKTRAELAAYKKMIGLQRQASKDAAKAKKPKKKEAKKAAAPVGKEKDDKKTKKTTTTTTAAAKVAAAVAAPVKKEAKKVAVPAAKKETKKATAPAPAPAPAPAKKEAKKIAASAPIKKAAAPAAKKKAKKAEKK